MGDDAPIGIRTDDPRYSIELQAFWIQNTGFQFTDPKIKIIDRDTGLENGEVSVTTFEGRIVDVEILDHGTGFRRIPDLVIEDETGFGAQIRPVLFPRLKVEEADLNVPPINVVFCPAKNQTNLAIDVAVGHLNLNSELVGYVNGQPYSGDYHTHDNGSIIMTGYYHTSASEIIVPVGSTAVVDSSTESTTSTTTSTSSSTSSSSSSSSSSSNSSSSNSSSSGGYSGGYY